MIHMATARSIAAELNVSRESWRRLEIYVELLDKWQRRIDLIGPATVDDIWQRHVADGLQLLPLVRPNVRMVLDLGSGAGIPGLIIAIGLQGRQPVAVHLVESTAKKAAFLHQAVMATGAPAVVRNCRIEELVRTNRLLEPQLVTARALAPLPRLLDLAAPWLERGAYGLFPKGQDVEIELTESAKSWRIGYVKHPSLLDPRGCILEVREVEHAV